MNQVKKNLVSNVVSLLINVVVGVMYTPYLVKELGIVAYGIVPIVLIINQYINILTGSLTSALTRFYSVALQKGDKKEVSKYLNTAFVVIIALIILLIFPVYLVVNGANNIFTVPDGLISETKYLFLLSIASFFCSLFSSVFNISLYALNRLDLLNVVKITRVSGKLVFVFLLFIVLNSNLIYVGIANLITEILVLIYSIFVFFKLSKDQVELGLKHYSNHALYSIGGLTVWVIVQQLGDTGLYRIDNLLVNMFWSSKESGVLGAFSELGSYSMVIVGVLGSLFGPLILIAYSKNEHLLVQDLTMSNSLIVGVLSAVFIGVLSGFSPIVLNLWLGEEFAHYYIWLVIKLAVIPFYSAAGVYALSARAWNKLRVPALITIGLGFVNFLLLYTLVLLSEGNIEYINFMLFTGFVLGLIQSYFLNGLYFSRLYPGNKGEVFKNFFKILIVYTGTSLICFLLNEIIPDISGVASLLLIFVIGVFLLIISIILVLNKKQKGTLKSLIYK